MKKVKKSNVIVKSLKKQAKKLGFEFDYHSDAELCAALRKMGVPSLAKLLKMIQKKPKK